jgi:membrane protease YdiL (CAAX protease family)
VSRRLDLPLAVAAWLAGFAWVRWKGSWSLLAALAVLAAVRLVAVDPETRRLLALPPLAPRRSAAALGAAGAAAAAVMIAATYAGYGLLSRMIPALPAATLRLYDLLNAEGYRRPALAALVLVMALCEEIVWRGSLLTGAERRAGARPVSWSSAARVAAAAGLYGACHLGSGSLLLASLAFGCGLAWGLVRVAGRSLWPAVLVHAAWDLAILVAWPLA